MSAHLKSYFICTASDNSSPGTCLSRRGACLNPGAAVGRFSTDTLRKHAFYRQAAAAAAAHVPLQQTEQKLVGDARGSTAAELQTAGGEDNEEHPDRNQLVCLTDPAEQTSLLSHSDAVGFFFYRSIHGAVMATGGERSGGV